jgi:hypothetical protein
MTMATPTRPAVQFSTRPFGSSFRAEWIKFWTLVSNRILVSIAVLFVPLNALLLSTSLRQRAEDPDPAVHIASVGRLTFLDSVLWLQLLIAVIAVLAASSENGGKIGMSFLAIPTRLPVLGAKAIVVTLMSFAVGAVGAVGGQLLPYALLSGVDVTYVADGADIVWMSLASGLYLGLIAAISLGIMILVKNLVVGLLLPLALFTIVPSLIGSVGGEGGSQISGFFPTVAGRTAISAMENPAGLDSTAGFLIMVAWAVVVLIGAGLRYRFADA